VPLRALRGATTVDVDEKDHVTERIVTLLTEMFERNAVDHDSLVSIIFTTTPDIRSVFPGASARTMGLGDVPLLGAQEADIIGGTPMCVRVLAHLESDTPRADLRHVYLEGAKGLRDDLPG
jgi:chorismate mutase